MPVLLGSVEEMRAAFELAHKKQFGFAYDNKPIVVEALEVETAGGGAGLTEPDLTLSSGTASQATTTRLYSEGTWHDAGIYKREILKPGMKVMGPRDHRATCHHRC